MNVLSINIPPRKNVDVMQDSDAVESDNLNIDFTCRMKRLSYLIFYFTWLWSSYFLTMSYFCNWRSHLLKPFYEKPLLTLDDVIENNVKLYSWTYTTVERWTKDCENLEELGRRQPLVRFQYLRGQCFSFKQGNLIFLVSGPGLPSR